MWKHFGLFVVTLTAFAGAGTLKSPFELPNEIEESIVRLLSLKLVDGLAQKCMIIHSPVLPPLPDPADLPDTYITLPDNSGNLTFCHSTVTGTSKIKDDLSFKIELPAKVDYWLDAPVLHIEGKHDVNFSLLGGMVEFISAEDYTVDLNDGRIELHLDVKVQLDGEFEILSASTQVAFAALAIQAPTFINGEEFDWAEFNAQFKEFFDTQIWPRIKPKVDAQVLETAIHMFKYCNIYTLMDGDFSCVNTGKKIVEQKLAEETNRIFKSGQGICPPKPTPPPHDGSYLIYSDNITNAGPWAKEVERCPKGSIVNAFQVKTEGNQSPFSDDTAMNGLKLFCGGTDQSVTSNEGVWGNWGETFTCSNGGYAKGFQLRLEGNGNIDNTAANNIRIFCTENTLEGDGMGWGSWRAEWNCEPNFAICGIKTQIEPDQSPANDDTALNNIAILCCPL